MKYLEFNKEKLVNLEYSLAREILLTNRAGGYVNTTIVCCNTRKYHGLFVIPIKEFGGEKHILLSNLQESLVQHEKSFNLGISSYGSIYEPRGHKYIVDFDMNYAATIVYNVGGMKFSKTIMFVRNAEMVLIKYTLLDAHSSTILRLKPFLAFRNIHSLTFANPDADTKYEPADNGVSFRMYEGFPRLYLQVSRSNEWIANPDWYKGIVYKEESRRGYADKEDLFVPGYFEMPIEKGESIIFSASTSEDQSESLNEIFDREASKRDNSRRDYDDCLRLAAQQFLVKNDGRYSVCSGYTWEYEDLRSSLVSIAGLTLFNDGDKVHFEKVVDDLLDYHRKVFLESGDSPDVPLLLSRTLQQYISFGADPAYVWKKYGNMLLKILDSYSGVKRDEAVIRSNGLLWTCRKGVALSWMNVYDGGCPVTERGGYQVETNALWYNALKFATAMDKKFGKGNAVKKWKKTIKSIEDNYFNYFWMEDCGYLADYVDENGKNRLTRPNQLIACCLDYTPLNDETRMEVVRSVKRHLLTAKGIRTLSPEDPGYKSVYEGNQHDRDMAHHNGCAYPWLLGDYIELNLKFIGAPFIKKGLALTNAFEEDINIHGIGSVAEIYDGDPFHKPHGCISCALSVAEIIRSRYLLNHFNKE